MGLRARRATVTVAGVVVVVGVAGAFGWVIDDPSSDNAPVAEALTETIEVTYADAVDGRFSAAALDPRRPWTHVFAFDALTPRRVMRRVAGESPEDLPPFVPERKGALVFVGRDAITYVELPRSRVSLSCLQGAGTEGIPSTAPLRVVQLGDASPIVVTVAGEPRAAACLRSLEATASAAVP
jgi:hypothetical protein